MQKSPKLEAELWKRPADEGRHDAYSGWLQDHGVNADRARLICTQIALESPQLKADERERFKIREAQILKERRIDFLKEDLQGWDPQLSHPHESLPDIYSQAIAPFFTFSRGYADAKALTDEQQRAILKWIIRDMYLLWKNWDTLGHDIQHHHYNLVSYFASEWRGQAFTPVHLKTILASAGHDPTDAEPMPCPDYISRRVLGLTSWGKPEGYPGQQAELIRTLFQHGVKVNDQDPGPPPNTHGYPEEAAELTRQLHIAHTAAGILHHAIICHCPVTTLKMLVEAGADTHLLYSMPGEKDLNIAQHARETFGATAPQTAYLESVYRQRKSGRAAGR